MSARTTAVDLLSAGARPAPLATEVMFSVGITLGGAMPAESREQASEIMQGALNALAEQLPGFVDLEAQVTVRRMPGA